MSTYTRFGSLLTKQVQDGQLPRVLFTDNADLRNSLGRVADLAYGRPTLDETQVQGSVESFSRVVNDQYVNAKYNAIFHDVADVFGTKLKRGVDELHMMKNAVNRLKEQMKDKINSNYAKDATLSAATGAEAPMAMRKIAWKIFDIIDERTVRANVNLSIGQDINKSITSVYVNQAINQLPFANQYNGITLQPIQLDSRKIDKIMDKLHASLTHINYSHINGILQNIFKLNESGMRSMVYTAKKLADGRGVDDMNKYMGLACEYVQIIDALKKDVLNVSNAVYEEYRKHADVFNKYAETILYIASYYRREVWQDSVLLPGNMLNTDTYTDYVNEGGKINDIIRHKNQFYTDTPIPTKGVSGKFIQSTLESLKQNMSETMAKNLEEIEKKKREAERDSFIAVSTEFINAHKSHLDPKFAHKKNVSRYAASVYDATVNSPVETRFYRMLMGSFHVNDIVSTLYNRLEQAYAESSETLGKIDAEDKLRIETNVYADMVSEYLVNSGIIVC